jgi:hypothetical protein
MLKIHANWTIFSKGKGERGKREGKVKALFGTAQLHQ